MRDSAREAIEFAANRARDELDDHRMLALALVKSIEIIGEAANQVSKETQDHFPEVPWRSLIAMRHRTIHGYIDVDYDIVWAVVTRDLPSLAEHLKRVVSALMADEPP